MSTTLMDPTPTPVEATQGPNVRSHHRRRHRTDETLRQRRNRLRQVYFAVSALWGCLAGTVGVIGAQSLEQEPLRLGAFGLALLGVAALAAILGGAVIAQAYRQAAHRASQRS